MNSTRSRITLSVTITLLAVTQLASGCIAEEELDLAELDDAVELEEMEPLDEFAAAHEELEPGEDASPRALCFLDAETFAEGNFSWHHQTDAYSCVIHQVDLNRHTSDYPAGQSALGDFPQYSGAFSLNDLILCTNSYILIERWHRPNPGSAWTQLTNKTQQATYAQRPDGSYRCRASFTPGFCGNLGHDLQKARVRPAPNGDLANPNGATVSHYFRKGVDC
ncbi:hypothetical protein [Nannocystis pusilla]|uniref:Uncharacterized protein n=1 Tax=Nannocystis pusilla TaxID=889268 RepID=A0ABS7U0Q9_9BACT|nr:hypothetical protein [Nannocystis pusilla]MBZ5713881.1 hypothetical protein [Nannocystis pusilla]